jgi:hypothetical protein
MRTRLYVAASVGLVLVSLTGCGGSNDKPSSAPMTEIAVRCDRYADTAKKITDAQKQIYGGTGGGAEAVASLRSELDGLKDGAPADVKAALTELGDAFEQALRDGDRGELAAMDGPRQLCKRPLMNG